MSAWRKCGSITGERGRELRRRLAARDGSRCFYCRVPFEDPAKATLDHYVPYSVWRCNRMRNLVLACAPCNVRKGDTLPLTLAWLLLALAEQQRPELGVAA